jgi:hydroxymethylglutaryl-CoA lyase
MKSVKVYEMFLRDGLQSLKTIYTGPQKIQMFNALNRAKYDCIEFGSTTNPKIIPQVGGSFELWNHIKPLLKHNTKYTMLVPSNTHLARVKDVGINSVGFITSISDEFSKRNMKMTSDESFAQTKEMITDTLIYNKDAHIRVYLSCSFGCPWSGFTETHVRRINTMVNELNDISYKNNISRDNFDIVLSDTVGMCDKYMMSGVLGGIEDLTYTGLHLHMAGKKNGMELEQDFKGIIDVALSRGIMKYDTSLFGVGGCPFAKATSSTDVIGNLSTIPFIKHIKEIGMPINVQLDKLEEAGEVIKEIL